MARPFLARLLLLGLTPALVSARPTAGWGKPPKAFERFFTSDPLALGRIPEVADDLALSPDQRAKLVALYTRLRREYDFRFRALIAVDRPESRTIMSRLESAYERESNGKLLALLSRSQRSRLRELQYQSLGFRALLLEDVRRKLGLLPEQLAETARIAHDDEMEVSRHSRNILIFVGRPREDHSAEFAQIEREFEAKALATLTPDQRAGYRRLIGVRLPPVEGTSPAIGFIMQ